MEENEIENKDLENNSQDNIDIDIDMVKNSLEKEFNCVGVDFFKYGKYQFVKAYEKDEKTIHYRYFNINQTNQLKEVEDDKILNYFREKYEPVLDVEYKNKT